MEKNIPKKEDCKLLKVQEKEKKCELFPALNECLLDSLHP